MSTPTAHTFGGADPDEGIFSSDPTDGKTIYESLNDALSASVEVEPLVLSVPSRPGVSLKFNPSIDFELYQSWVDRASKSKTGPNGKKVNDGNPDYLRLSLTVISHTNVGIVMNGKDVYGPDNQALDIKSPEIHRMLGAPIGGVASAIRKMYGSDGHAIQTMHKVIEAAGYSLTGDVEEGSGDDPLELL